MNLKQCRGYQLIKSQSNTPEEFFTRSEVTYILDGEEKTLHVLYVTFFEEQALQILPYGQEPLFNVKGREVYLKDIVALIYLLDHPDSENRKRIYVSNPLYFSEYLKNADFTKIEKMMWQLE